MGVKPGIRLGERYQLLSPIATGGMGQVWRAEDTTLHRVVAAKILRSEFAGDETFLARFRAEARNTAALSHPNIASVYDYGEQVHDSERMCYLIMELVDGKPLVDILAQERRLSPSRTLDYLEQTAMGLAAAHREGMVHRDIKPGNLIIRPDGVVKITDFGIARAANAVALTEQGTVVGTAQYLAPEQAEGKPARPASDVYALGVVGYECLAGVRPFDGDNSVAIALAQIRDLPRPLPADIPQNVRSLIELTMRKNPAARYPDGAVFVKAVKSVRAGGMPTAPPNVPAAAPAPPRQLPGGPRLAPGTPLAGPPPRPGPPPPGAQLPGAQLPGAQLPHPAAPPAQNAAAPNLGPRHGAPQPTGPQPPAPRPARMGPQNPASGHGMSPVTGRAAQPPAAPTGQHPFVAPPSSPATGVPAPQGPPGSSTTGVSAVRPPSAGDTSTGLAPVHRGPSGSATGNFAPPPAPRKVPWVWIILAAAVLIALIVTIIVLSGQDPGAPEGLAHTTALDLKEDLR